MHADMHSGSMGLSCRDIYSMTSQYRYFRGPVVCRTTSGSMYAIEDATYCT